MKRELFFISIICILMLTSCVSSPVYFNKSAIDIKKSKIAVLPFRDYNSNDGNNSGELVRSLFEQRLLLKGFGVIEIEKTSSSVDYSFLKKNEYPGDWITETGNKLGADYMIYGSVHDYRVYQNLTSFLYIFSWLEVTSSVGVTARMVSCKTGEVVWSGSFSRSSYTFNDAASEAVYALIRTIKRDFIKSE
jgi:TolB-like protein